jgi:transposase
VLDGADCHTALKSRRLAADLGIELVWLPKQWSELNAMGHLWKGLKQKVAANRQYGTVDEQADWAERWVLGLTPREALRKAGVLSDHFWLKAVV